MMSHRWPNCLKEGSCLKLSFCGDISSNTCADITAGVMPTIPTTGWTAAGAFGFITTALIAAKTKYTYHELSVSGCADGSYESLDGKNEARNDGEVTVSV